MTAVRQGFMVATRLIKVAPYLASLGALVLLALLSAPDDRAPALAGMWFVTIVHLLLLTYSLTRGMRQTVSLLHACLMVAVPFLTTPYTPFVWIVFLIPVIHHAIIYRSDVRISVVFLALPWIALGLYEVLGGETEIGLGPVVLFSLLSAGIHFWLSTAMDMFDRYFDQHEELRLERALRKERARIRMDLHDGLGASLTGLALRSRVALQTVRQDPQTAGRYLTEIERTANTSVHQVHLFSQSVLKKPLQIDEFESALRQSCIDTAADRVRVVVKGEDCTGLGPSLVYHLTLLVSEALNNAIRHGDAGHIDVEFFCSDSSWSLSIEDDGRGLGEKPGGLRTIEKRTRTLGAELTVESAEGKGTRLTVRGENYAPAFSVR